MYRSSMMSPTTRILSFENPPSRRFNMECSSGSIEVLKLLPLIHCNASKGVCEYNKWAPSCSSQNSTYLGEHLIHADRQDALLLFHKTGIKIATPALDLVIEHTMFFAVRKPDARLASCREDSDAWCLHRGCKVHRPTIMP